MGAEKQPILVPRNPEKGQDPSTRRVEVWNTDTDYHARGAADRILASDSTRLIQEVNQETGKTALVPLEESFGVDVHGPEGQEALARELAQLPLRGDKAFTIHEGQILEGEVVDYYTVEGVKYGVFGTENGQKINIFIDNLNPKSQAELAEAHNKQSILEQGHAELTAAEVQEPEGPSPWSYEASMARKERAATERGGLPEKGLWHGREVEIVNISKDADGTEHVRIQDVVDGDYSLVNRSELSFDIPEAAEQVDTIANLTADLPKSHDKRELESFAATSLALESIPEDSPSRSGYIRIRAQNWNRMSQVAKDRAIRYVEVVRRNRPERKAA